MHCHAFCLSVFKKHNKTKAYNKMIMYLYYEQSYIVCTTFKVGQP